jgi:citrate lyase subunit beta/citryl-CoA lyase
MVRRSRRFGFLGASCIHPSQLPILNEEFSPTAEEMAYATRVVQAHDEAIEAGCGSFALDGRMIDAPIALRARRLIARHAALKAKQVRAHSPATPGPPAT